MVVIWLFMMAAVTDMHLDDYKICKQTGFRAKACEKFKPKPIEKKWW